MIVQNKKNARIFEIKINNIMGADTIEVTMPYGGHSTLYGKNGAGKSSVIYGLRMALEGKKIPYKIDNPVGPYSTGKIKKGTVDVGIEGDPGVLELNGDTLEKFYIHFSITKAGTVGLKVTDEITGKIHTSPPREKIKNLLGLFIDPVELRDSLKETDGDKKLAENVSMMMGYDLTKFANRDKELFEKFQDENKELARQKGEFASLDVPQDDWATEYTDPELISSEQEKLNNLRYHNEKLARIIADNYAEFDRAKEAMSKYDEELTKLREQEFLLRKTIEEKKLAKVDAEKNLTEFKEKNQPVEWEGTKNIEEKIRELTEELQQYRIYEKKEQEKQQAIDLKTRAFETAIERLNLLETDVEEKSKLIVEKEAEKQSFEDRLKTVEEKADGYLENAVFQKWDGMTDPDGKLFPFHYLKYRMNRVEKDNYQVKAREAYELAEIGIKAVENSIKEIKRQRKENDAEKSRMVASLKGKFPHPWITVDFKNPNLSEQDSINKKNDITIWVDKGDRRGPRTINDLSEGEKLLICTHILIAGNKGALNIIVIRDGSNLDSDNRQIIYDVAAEHGYTVILETIETTEAGALHIVEGRVDRVNPEPVVEGKPAEKVEETKPDSGMNWG